MFGVDLLSVTPNYKSGIISDCAFYLYCRFYQYNVSANWHL